MTTVVLTEGVVVVTYAGFPGTGTVVATPVGVVDVVVVVTLLVGAIGGGAETTCEVGSVAQPAKRPTAPQSPRKDARAPERRACTGEDCWGTGFTMPEDYRVCAAADMGCSR